MKKLNKVIQKLVIGALFIAPTAVYASTAANTTVTNTVTVFYKDATEAQNYSGTATATFTVSLLAAAPTIVVAPTAQNTSETTSGIEIQYTVTANANGADAYTFALSPIVAGTNLTAATADAYSLVSASGVFNPTTGVLTLGGTTLAAQLTNGATTLTVPWDGEVAGTNAAVNGLVAGDIIVLGGAEYTIASIDNSAADTNNYTQITLTTAYAGTDLPVGTIVGERAVIKLSFTSGTLQNGASTEDYTIAPVVTYSSLTVTATTATVTVQRPTLAISKYVRNITTPVAGTGDITVAGATFYSSGVNGKPGDVMEYLIHIDNTVGIGASKATNIVVSDVLPEFTSINTGSIKLLPATHSSLTGIVSGDFTTVNPATAGSAAELATGTLCVYAGAGGDNSGTNTVVGTPCVGTGGALGPDASALPTPIPAQRSIVVFQVTID